MVADGAVIIMETNGDRGYRKLLSLFRMVLSLTPNDLLFPLDAGLNMTLLDMT